MLKTQSPVKNCRRLSNICSNSKLLHLRDQPVRQFPNTGSNQTASPNTGSRPQTRSQTKSGSSTPKPESSTPKTESQTQRLTSSKPGRKTTDSYAKQPPNQTWEEVLAKKDNKTQALEHDRALALSLIASSSQAINKQEYDLANAKFALELAQKRPPQVPTPLLVTPPITLWTLLTLQNLLKYKMSYNLNSSFSLEHPTRYRGIHVEFNQTLYPLSVAKILRALVVVEAIDDDCNQTGQMIVGLLNWPQGTFASKMSVSEEALDANITEEDGVTEPKIIVQTRSEVDLLDDGFRWPALLEELTSGWDAVVEVFD
ncbi:hypothetical protein K1719_037404 [Acacia pycnantha]|nr:hypothetical protein K1719_037404 [Acacia pycnantha]